MGEKTPKRSFWLNVETVIIAVFFLFFIVWAMRKCGDESRLRSAGDNKYREQFLRDSIARANRALPPPTPIPTTTPTTVTSTTANNTPPPLPPAPQQPATQQSVAPAATNNATNNTTNNNAQLLWVVIDGVNVREKPELNAKSYGKLKLHDKVTFMNDVTKETTKLSIGSEETDEPWIKIKTKRGTVGWVYGAGVSYYKTKRKGAF